VVKLKDGSVVEVSSEKEAEKLLAEVEKILFLGDLLVSVGDFAKSNHPLMPSAWCEERFELMARKAGIAHVNHHLSAGEAVSLSRKSGIPLHPRYTYFWHDIEQKQLRELALWLKTGKPNYGILRLESFELEHSPAKAVLEELCVPHRVEKAKVIIEGEHAYALLKTLGIMVDRKITGERFESLFDEKKPVLELLAEISGMKIMAKAPTYIGTRMGRPEKARQRRMAKSVNVLFPVGTALDKNASISKAYARLKQRGEREGKGVEVEIARMRCSACRNITISTRCACGGSAVPERTCPKCRRLEKGEVCSACGGRTALWNSRPINLVALYERAAERCGLDATAGIEVKGVEGLFSETKIPEPIEKGMLRALHEVFVFRDGTCRFDATDVPLTHFKPSEISTSVEKLRQLGYDKDKDGKRLESEDQLVPLKPQDVILSRAGAEYLMRVAAFVDDELARLYGMEPFYSLKSEEDLVGQLAIGLSPHTSAGVLCRIIGFTDAHVGFAHPYFHCAKRRNTDGDEDTVILLMDALLNFSRAYLPVSRGGTMDAPLVLTTRIKPNEIDDEVHAMEVCESYPLALYELADRFASPSELEIENVKKLLGKPQEYGSLPYTHDTSDISAGPHQSAYLRFDNMEEKIRAQFELQDKIRAVNAADAAERLLLHHFFPDLYGNLRSFSQQEFRCLDCKVKYRRIPLTGKCNRCGGKLLLTIYKGGITKYLQHSLDLIDRYRLPLYMRQRAEALKKDIESVFAEEVEKQRGLAEFM
ncbi:MAG: DNA polymerase II large subunit, partial [Candidatus Micrarchaeota archaeon]|nr:DNA polymerase II large subunit [Candidatus Micrarchaeota archaeon]